MPNPPQPQQDGIADDFFEQIFSMPGYSSGDPGLSAGDGSGSGGFAGFPLELRLEQGRPGYAATEEVSSGSMSGVGKRLREAAEGRASSDVILHGQSMQLPIAPIPQLSAHRPRVRARRGQATDPHSIAERLRRERIAERMRALQELVPNTNKTDRAAMLDEIVDYVKFLRLQVKFLSMSRLGGAGAGAQLVADIPISQAEGDSGSDARNKQQVWEKWSNDGTERHVLKLMEEDVGAAMQFLQSKALCMMPIPLASAFYRTQSHLENPSAKPEPNTPPS